MVRLHFLQRGALAAVTFLWHFGQHHDGRLPRRPPGPWLLLFTFAIVTAASSITAWKLNYRLDHAGGPRMIAARLQGAQFPAAHLAGAVLDGAVITGADFTSADLELAQLDGV